MLKHFHHPEIDPFYRDVVETYKRGGRKRKHKTKTKGVTNQNIIKINIGSDKLGKSKYAQMNHTTRLQRNARPMANPPSVSIQSSFAVPNPVAYPARHVEIGENSIPAPQVARVEVASRLGVPNFTSENPGGIVPVSSHPSRAVPSRLGNHGGVAYQSPEAIRAQSYAPEEEDYALGSVSYFRPTGRDNLPLPHQARRTAAAPVDFFPNRGQASVPIPEEIERMHGGHSPRARRRSPSRDEDFLSPEQSRESQRRENISLGHRRAAQAAPSSAQSLLPLPRQTNVPAPSHRTPSFASPSPAGRTSGAASSSEGMKFGGMKKHSVF